MYKFPDLQQLNLQEIPLVHGFYTLGIVEKYCPNIALVFMRLARNDQWLGSDLNPELVFDEIQDHLQKNKKVLVVPFDEYVMGDDYNFSSVLNQFENEPVYFVTEMDDEQSLYWRFQKKLTCKILELPFILLNDAICYNKLKKVKTVNSALESNYNFLCMINRSENSKYDLCKMLLDLDLAKHGLVTYRSDNAPAFVKENFTYNPDGPIDPGNLPTKNRQEAGQLYDNNILASGNVLNYFHLEQTYDIPLIINPESTVGIFPNTEKSLWPALLGKMYLIYGHQHIMSWVQRFCTHGPENFCDLTFDNVEGYSEKDHLLRLETMLTKNKDLILNAREIYLDHKDKLEINRVDIVKNLYNFFISQLNSVGDYTHDIP